MQYLPIDGLIPLTSLFGSCYSRGGGRFKITNSDLEGSSGQKIKFLPHALSERRDHSTVKNKDLTPEFVSERSRITQMPKPAPFGTRNHL